MRREGERDSVQEKFKRERLVVGGTLQYRVRQYSTAQHSAGQKYSTVQYRAGQDGNFKTRDRVTECVKAVTTYYIL